MDASTVFRLTALAISKEREERTSSAGAPQAIGSEISDEALMIRICDGSREALAILFRRYARLVRTVAMRVLRSTIPKLTTCCKTYFCLSIAIAPSLIRPRPRCVPGSFR